MTTTDNASRFWAVRYGGQDRVTSAKYDKPTTACVAAFGLIAESMAVKPLSTKKRDLQRTSYIRDAMANPEGWRLLTLEELPDNLERIARRSRKTRIENGQVVIGDPPLDVRAQDEPKRPAAQAVVVVCDYPTCYSQVLKLTPYTGEPPVFLNLAFPLSLHTCGEPPAGEELIMLPALLISAVHEHTILNAFDKEEGRVKMFGLGLDDYSVIARRIRALLVGDPLDEQPPPPAVSNAHEARPTSNNVRRMVVEWITRGGDPGATLRAIHTALNHEDEAKTEATEAAFELARELKRQEESGVRVDQICECVGSKVGKVVTHRPDCLYSMALRVVALAGKEVQQ